MRYGKNSTKRYDLIYADPPWKYSFSKSKSREIENQYPTMTLGEICNTIAPAKKDALLLLWATAPKLLEALQVMDAWNFKYITHGIWDKGMIGMGYWFRGKHELLLVGKRGKFSPPAPADRWPSIIQSRRTKHSRKPQLVRDWINSAFPDATKLEMFARESFPGWDRWGNE